MDEPTNEDPPDSRVADGDHPGRGAQRLHDAGIKAIRHPVVGDLHLTFEALPLPADPGQSLIVYGAEPGSETADRLRLLVSWVATAESSDVAP